jgi:hypothetical protein
LELAVSSTPNTQRKRSKRALTTFLLDQINHQKGKKYVVVEVKKDKAVMIGNLLKKKFDVSIQTYDYLKKFLNRQTGD